MNLTRSKRPFRVLARTRWLEYGAVVAITLIAAVLRIYNLANWSPWVDELYTLVHSRGPAMDILLDNAYLYSNKVVLDFIDTNPFSLRLTAFIFGVLGIPVLYFPIRALLGRGVAALTAFFIAISPWHVYLSQLARWYSLLFVVSTLALISFYFFVETNSKKYLIYSGVLFVIGFSLHLTAAFVLVIAAVYLLLLLLFPAWKPASCNLKVVKIVMLSLSVVALALSPRFWSFLQQWAAVQQRMGYWGSTPLVFSLKTLYQLTPTMVALALAGIVLLLRRGNRQGIFLAAYCLVPVIALNLAAMLQVNVSAKYVFFVLPAVLMAASYLLKHTARQLYDGGYAVMAVFIVAASLPSVEANYVYFTTGHGNRDRMQEAAQFIHRRASTGDQIYLHFLFHKPEEGDFYFRGTATLCGWDFASLDCEIVADPAKLDSSRNIWVVTRNVLSGASNLESWLTDHAKLEAEFKAVRGQEDNTIKVYFKSGRRLQQHAQHPGNASIPAAASALAN